MRTEIAVNRFGLGARPGEIARIGPDGAAWLNAQVSRAENFAVQGENLPTSAEAFELYRDFVANRREQQRASADAAASMETMQSMDSMESASSEQGSRAQQRQAQQDVLGMVQVLALDISARTQKALVTDNGFAERLVWFWSNHFTVSATKASTIAYVGPYEREAIRPNLTGSFTNLLLASARHPGMLQYLDQAQSVGPNSRAAERRELGLNENLAREILELHTLGADAGYTQDDVIEFAKAMTGWTIHSRLSQRLGVRGQAGETAFIELMHEPGSRTVLGRTYRDSGPDQSTEIMRDLARHPATARHIATKLVRHFIADDPPPAAVARLQRVFLRTDGDLPSLHRELAECPEANTVEPTKFKTPQEFFISSCRLVGVESLPLRGIRNAYDQLGQPLYRAPSPAGWDDVSANWAGPDAIMKRIEWSQAFARLATIRTPPEALLSDALGEALSEDTRRAISRAQTTQQGLTLALMSSEFQRR